MPQSLSNARMTRINTRSVLMLVSAVIGKFLEDNPDFNLGISLHILSNNPNIKARDNDHAQRLMLEMLQVEALLDENVQKKVEKFILKTYPRVREITIQASETHINAVCLITATPKLQY
ncbi:MAG TPA: hypothetical protein DEA43_00385 [Candidatus Moranbacteria bacterium]|nr:hypothetical protein [Candidatus Moranbacteria bacterium]HBT45329.1 hypothetical protein [Candidatus Moranbacteria bacterium]